MQPPCHRPIVMVMVVVVNKSPAECPTDANLEMRSLPQHAHYERCRHGPTRQKCHDCTLHMRSTCATLRSCVTSTFGSAALGPDSKKATQSHTKPQLSHPSWALDCCFVLYVLAVETFHLVEACSKHCLGRSTKMPTQGFPLVSPHVWDSHTLTQIYTDCMAGQLLRRQGLHTVALQHRQLLHEGPSVSTWFKEFRNIRLHSTRLGTSTSQGFPKSPCKLVSQCCGSDALEALEHGTCK